MLVYVSQRVDVHAEIGERRDALDARWHLFLGGAGFRVLPVPNDIVQVKLWLENCPPKGIVLGGGNTPSAYGGIAPERCETDNALLCYAVCNKIPVLGVCRGMQSIVLYFGGSLKKVGGHVAARHNLRGHVEKNVNSYHDFAVNVLPEEFVVTAKAEDGIVEAVRHKYLPIIGIMWHPEREDVFCGTDLEMLMELRGNL